MAKYSYQVALMPSASVTDIGWLNAYGSGAISGSSLSGSWQLVNVVPVTTIVKGSDGITPVGNILCYFMSSSS